MRRSNLGGVIVDAEPLILRGMLWDMVPHSLAPEYVTRVGLYKSSPEGTVKDDRASHIRLSAVVDVMPAVTVVSRCASLVSKMAILENQGSFTTLGEFLETDDYVQTVTAIVMASLSSLIDLQVVHVSED